MTIPGLNWPALLLEYAKHLALPIEIYAAVKRLKNLIQLGFTYDIASGRRRHALSYPEAQLISVVVVSTKLLFPFDGDALPRHPYSTDEPGAQCMDWRSWEQTMMQFQNREELLADGGLRPGAEVNIKDSDVFDLSEKQLDQYMDWYQRTWTSLDQANDDVHGEILNMFPLRQLPDNREQIQTEIQRETASWEKVQAAQAHLNMTTAISEEEETRASIQVLRPGMHYQEFREVEDLKSCSPPFSSTKKRPRFLVCLSSPSYEQ